MTSISLEKTFMYLKIRESLQSENRTGYYLYKGIYYVFLFQCQPKVSSSTRRSLGGHSEGTWAFERYSKGTRAFRALEHSKGT